MDYILLDCNDEILIEIYLEYLKKEEFNEITIYNGSYKDPMFPILGFQIRDKMITACKPIKWYRVGIHKIKVLKTYKEFLDAIRKHDTVLHTK
jgi:hypothetical protein